MNKSSLALRNEEHGNQVVQKWGEGGRRDKFPTMLKSTNENINFLTC